MDIAPFGTALRDGAGVEWSEERDIREIHIRYASAAARGLKVEYWFHTWPYRRPAMPTIEDPADDRWQGRWLQTASIEECSGTECRYTFQPLSQAENPRAANLPGVTYRRTLKVRLTPAGDAPPIAAIRVFSGTREQRLSLRISLEKAIRGIEVFNGKLNASHAQGTREVLADITAAELSLPGSLDSTVVTIHTASGRAFSFDVGDLKNGPISVPDFHACITLDDQHAGCDAVRGKGPRIRQQIPSEPEQSYERAFREIPSIDPWQKQSGERAYLPLAADSSWQKFAFEYGGDVFISKRGVKAKAGELARLLWEGDRIRWKIGTGETPYFRDDRAASVSKLDGYLPVVAQRWKSEGLEYSEEAFATLLRGPLSPRVPDRNEQTPAVLMMRLTAVNPGGSPRMGHFWLFTEPRESLNVSGPRVRASGRLRAVVQTPGGEPLETADGGVRTSFAVPAGGSRSVVINLPFVSDLNDADAAGMEALSYDAQRAAVVEYWREVVRAAVGFSLPEAKFNLLARSVIPHIHISATKNPNSGLYMAPAASYDYQVYANEASFQALMLDALGDHTTAAEYLETFLRLQGSRNFPGLHRGSADAIFHGARVDAAYDYTASDYGLDHGTVLWALAEHYLFSRDRAWLEHAWPHMDKAIGWIVEQREATKRAGPDGRKAREYGLLPASHLEDNADWANWFSINAFAWAGIDRTAQALADIGHPEAARLRREADAYRADLREAVLRAAASAPVTRLRDGTYAPYVPVEPFQRFRRFGPKRIAYYTRYGISGTMPNLRLSATREVLYGPIILLNLGVFGTDEPIASWILDDWEDNLTLSSGLGMNVHGITDDALWFSQGGMVFQANLQNPTLVYLRRHEIPAAIRNLYNGFVACLYPEVNVFAEEYRMWRHASGPFYKIPDEARFTNRLRDLVALEDGETLWLASGAPRRWLASQEGIRVDRVLTYFGPVSYSLHAGAKPGVVEADVVLPSRNPPRKAWLVARVPSGRIESVTIDGQPWDRIDRKLEAVELPAGRERVHVEIRYR